MRCMSGCRVCSHLTREKYNSGEKTLNFKYSLYSYIHNTNQNFQIINSNEEEYWALQAVTTCSLIVMAIPTPNSAGEDCYPDFSLTFYSLINWNTFIFS